MRVQRSINKLKPPFMHAAIWLVHLIEENELPLKVYETLRSDALQQKYFDRGVTRARPGQSAHNHGFAVDFILDTDKISVRRRGWRGRMYPDAWDDESPNAVEVWSRFGELVRGLDLTWGGDWIAKNAKPKTMSDGSSIILGWDLPHVEIRGWRR